MRTLAAIIALLALTTGCSTLQPAASPSNASAEADPWAGFNNGYAKNEAPAGKAATNANAEAKADDKTSKTETTSAALSTDDKGDKSDKSDKTEAKSDATDEDESKPVKKKGKKKAAKKKPAGGATVATKKPRKRAKKI